MWSEVLDGELHVTYECPACGAVWTMIYSLDLPPDESKSAPE